MFLLNSMHITYAAKQRDSLRSDLPTALKRQHTKEQAMQPIPRNTSLHNLTTLDSVERADLIAALLALRSPLSPSEITQQVRN